MMRRLILLVLLTISISALTYSAAEAQWQRERPWPVVKLSTLPSVVGMANSWEYEINHRSPAYLSDLDKMYVTFAWGFGGADDEITAPSSTAIRDSYDFFRGLDYSAYDMNFNVYAQLGPKTYGSMWVNYGKREDRTTNKSIVESIPSFLSLKAAFAWKPTDKLTVAASGSINNWPRSLLFVLQTRDARNPQEMLPADGGEDLIGEVDLMYRTETGYDIIVGGTFMNLYTKFDATNPIDTAEIKEYIYSGAPKVMVKKTFRSGDYLRVGGAYYFNLFDYQYEAGGIFRSPHEGVPSFHPQLLSSLTPEWRLFADGTKLLNASGKSALYLNAELASYPNKLSISDTEFLPIDLSLVEETSLTSTLLTAELTSRLTRILHAMVGVDLRIIGQGSAGDNLDDNSLYATLKFGTTTRFYRSLWWSITIPAIKLYDTESLGSSILFNEPGYIETQVLFIGL